MVRVFNEILGKEVTIPDRPSRIISFSPAVTESLFMLGLGAKVVGVTAFCGRPPEARERRKVGSYSTVSRELLEEMKPDLIFTVTGYQRDFAVGLSERFPVYPFELPVSVAGVVDLVVKLGLVVGENERGRELSSRLIRKVADISPLRKRPRVYVEIDLGGPVSFGAYSYITDAIHLVGASTLFDGVRSEWLTPDLEEIRRQEPDAFLYEGKMYSKFSSDDLERLIDERGWRGMKAVRSRSYFLTPGPLDFLAHHGPSFITDSIPWLSEKLNQVCERDLVD